MKKKSAWLAFMFMVMACFIIEQMAATILGHSGLLEKIYFACAAVGIPGICLAVGFENEEKPGFRKVWSILYECALLAVFALLSQLLTKGFDWKGLLKNEILQLAGILFVLELAGELFRKLPKAVIGAFAVIFAGLYIALPGFFCSRDLLIGACFYFLGRFLKKCGFDAGKTLAKPYVILPSVAIGLGYGAAILFAFPTVRKFGCILAPEHYGNVSSPVKAAIALAVVLVVVFAMLSFANVIDYLASGMGSRYRAALVGAVIGQYLLIQGWVLDIAKSMDKSHWTLIITIFIGIWTLLCMSESMHVVCELLMWPVGSFRGNGFKFTRIFKNIAKYRFLLRELIKKGIVLKYRRSFFGILWSLFEPLLTMMVLTFVFSNFFGKNDPFYPIYILTGRLLFSMFQTTTGQALKSVRGNSSMIKKVYVPKYMYPLSTVLYNFVLFLISLIDLVLVMIFYDVPFTWHLLESFVPIFILLIFAIGIGMILATVNVFFRDIEYLWNVFMLLLMYCSAIFYRTKGLGADKQWIFKLNPVYLLIYNFRLTIIGPDKGAMKNIACSLDPATLIPATVMAFASLIIGIVVFYKKQDEFILHI